MFDFMSDAEKAKAFDRLQHHPRVRRVIADRNKFEAIKQRKLARMARHASRKAAK